MKNPHEVTLFPKISLSVLPYTDLLEMVEVAVPKRYKGGEAQSSLDYVQVKDSPAFGYADKHIWARTEVMKALTHPGYKPYELHINDLLSYLAQEGWIDFGLYVILPIVV